ncbi:hypothetical protein V7x_39300 [Crateriforma conspicua]|uniref:NapA signal peptide-binding chaperone NapD n=2 Tax=Planctomycetaceae TaxID=126 RepID=A0A5C6FQ44_9PLAN|nr:hypothetical protein V7x_39300 [Crateriforma conspicua]
MPISGLVVTFESSVSDHEASRMAIGDIPEVDLGQAVGSKLAIVVDSETKGRDRQVWEMVQGMPGVIDVAIAMVAFDGDEESKQRKPINGS